MVAPDDDLKKSAEDHEELRILPPEGPSREEISRQLEPVGSYSPPVNPPAPRLQFTIADVMVLMFAVAIGLAGGTWAPVEIFAAVMGIVMLCGLLVVHLYPPQSHWARLAWWSLGLAYTTAVLAAIVKPTTG